MNTTASGPVRNRRTVVIEVVIDIARPAEAVFGYCSDHTNEIEWNPAMRRVAKITDGPVGVGTRYEMQFLPGRPIVAECVRFDPWPAGRWTGRGPASGHHSPAGSPRSRPVRGSTFAWRSRPTGCCGPRCRCCGAGCRGTWPVTSPSSRPGWKVRSRARHHRTRPAYGSQAALRAIKAIHTLAWFSIEACMAYVLYAGLARRSDRRAASLPCLIAR